MLDQVSSISYNEGMESPLAIALRESKGPDDLYGHAFHYFQTLFRSHPNANVRTISVLSHDLPAPLARDRRMMGTVFSGAIVAMLDHEADCGVLNEIPAELHAQLDEIIIEQGAVTGAALLTSDLVLSRVSEWERTDYRKYKRWLKSLDKASRVHQQLTAAPLDDVFLPEVKRRSVEQLRPLMSRLQERLAKQRRVPSEQQIVAAFEEEARSPEATFLSNPHNHQQWFRFFSRDPVSYMYLSPEKLWDEFTGFVKSHKAGYVRKKISALK
jgi:hypothetical protein